MTDPTAEQAKVLRAALDKHQAALDSLDEWLAACQAAYAAQQSEIHARCRPICEELRAIETTWNLGTSLLVGPKP